MIHLPSIRPETSVPILDALKYPKSEAALAETVGLPVSVVHSRIKVLRSAGYITEHGKKFRAVKGAPRVKANAAQFDTLCAVMDGITTPMGLSHDLSITPNGGSARMRAAAKAGLIRLTGQSNGRQTYYEPTPEGLALVAWVSR